MAGLYLPEDCDINSCGIDPRRTLGDGTEYGQG